jgi:O-antigen ligase
MCKADSEQGDGLFYFLLFILAWAPLPMGSNGPWPLWLLNGLVFTLGALCVLQLLRGRLSVNSVITKAWLPLVLLLLVQVWVFVQTLPTSIQTTDSWATTTRLYQGLAYTAMFAMVLILVNSRARIRLVCYTLVLSGVFQATYGGFMTLSGLEYGFFYEKGAYIGTATGTFLTRPHLAGYLVLCLAVGIGLLLADMEKRPAHSWREFYRRVTNTLLGPKLRLRLFLAIMVIGLVLTRSRMGNMAFFTGLVSMGFLSLYLQRRLTRNALLLFGSLLLVDALIVGNWFGFEKVVDRIENTSIASEQRDDVSVYTFEMLKDNWVTGAGAGSFYTNFPHYRGSDVNGYWSHAHNDYVELGAEYGTVGFLPMALFVLGSFWASIQIQRRRRSRLFKSIGFTASMAVIWLVMSSWVDFNMHVPANALTFIVIMGLAWVSLYQKDDRESNRPLSYAD